MLSLHHWKLLVAAENADAMFLAKRGEPITEITSTMTNENNDKVLSTTLVKAKRQSLALSNDNKTPNSTSPIIATTPITKKMNKIERNDKILAAVIVTAPQTPILSSASIATKEYAPITTTTTMVATDKKDKNKSTAIAIVEQSPPVPLTSGNALVATIPTTEKAPVAKKEKDDVVIAVVVAETRRPTPSSLAPAAVATSPMSLVAPQAHRPQAPSISPSTVPPPVGLHTLLPPAALHTEHQTTHAAVSTPSVRQVDDLYNIDNDTCDNGLGDNKDLCNIIDASSCDVDVNFKDFHNNCVAHRTHKPSPIADWLKGNACVMHVNTRHNHAFATVDDHIYGVVDNEYYGHNNEGS